MTSAPASVFEITDRGLVSEGYYADLNVFDPDDIESPASFEDPHQYSKGMTHVMVNGQFAREDGQFTDFVDGRVLQHGR